MRKKMRHPLGGRGTGAKTRATQREMLDWQRRYREAIESGRNDGGALIVEAVNKWGYGTVKRMMGVRRNPREFGPDDYILDGEIVTPLSETQELAFVITILHDALRRNLSGGARYDVTKAIEVLSRLKEQALRGLHRNPARRRQNPPLVLMGVNPPDKAKVIRANWGRIEYCRPDDPEGKNVARVHDFPDGFIAHGLADGTVLLRHPKGRRLWTRR